MNNIKIIKPDDWHTHLREGEMLRAVIDSTARTNSRCIAMPNLKEPITSSVLGIKYINEIEKIIDPKQLKILLPCYLSHNLDLKDFEKSLLNNIFVGAKLYPQNATTNSEFGVENLDKIFPAIEILEKNNKPLLIHCEKSSKDIDIFDREKYFIDDELSKIIKNFSNLKIIFEHVSSKYGADFIQQNNNIAGTITPHHMLLTKKDVFNDEINPHNYCMPIVKNEEDLISLRKYACSGNKNFFLGTDSAPHQISDKEQSKEIKPGIFSAPCSIELYTQIFEEENSLDELEKFSSINGPNFYNFSINSDKISLIKKEWIVEDFTVYNDIKIKNFYAGKKISWKIQN